MIRKTKKDFQEEKIMDRCKPYQFASPPWPQFCLEMRVLYFYKIGHGKRIVYFSLSARTFFSSVSLPVRGSNFSNFVSFWFLAS